MNDNSTINMTWAANKGDLLLISLVGLETEDVKSIATIIGPFFMKKKEAVCLAMFPGEKEKCSYNIWSQFEMMMGKGMFLDWKKESYGDLFRSLADSGKTIYVVAKEMKEREFIFAENTAGARLFFCDLGSDGTLLKARYYPRKPRTDEERKDKGYSYGQRERKPYERRENSEGKPNGEYKKKEWEQKRPPRDYQIASVPTLKNIHRLSSAIPMGEGAVLQDSAGGTVRLVKKVLRNNGAYTYITDRPGLWAKVYDDNYNYSFFEDKIRRMLQNPVDVKGVIWPKDVLADQNGVFRGYLMDSFTGAPLQTSVLKRDGQEKLFPAWKKEDICELTLAILGIIKELHKRGILMGCINPAAIRVAGKNEVYFCDTDDYQIEGYPTLSNNISFAAPENLGKKLYLTSLDSENFSVAELVFMLMMTGKTPYLSGNNSNVIETIQGMRFPFFINDFDERNPNLRVVPSMWRYMWSHLSPEMKKAFINTFQKNLYNNPQGKRLYASRWYDMVQKYREEVVQSADPEDHKLYPMTFKKKEGDVFYRCRDCGTEHPKFFFDPKYFDDERVCNVCMDKPSDKSYSCVDCGRTFFYKKRTALYHKKMREIHDDWHDQRHCPECKNKKETCKGCGKRFPYYELYQGMCKDCRENTVFRTIRCRSCGEDFNLTYAEKKYYDAKGYDYPKDCKACRDKKKNGGNNGNNGSGRNGRTGWFW